MRTPAGASGREQADDKMTADAKGRASADMASVDEYIAEHGVVQAIQVKRVASLLMTYRCTLACAHCLFNCGPRQPRRYHSVEHGVRYLRMLHETDRVIHIAGGEAMMEYETMLAICREASSYEAAPHFVETNATWCTNTALVRRRLRELKETGMRGLYISADPFHLAFFPVDRYLRCYEVAVELFGEENVMAPKATRQELQEMQEIGRDPERLAELVRESPPQMVGRAGEALARLLPPRPIEELGGDGLWQGEPEGMSCAREFDPDTMWEMHIDPYDNIQTCCGVIVGNGRRTPLPELMAAGFAEGNPIVAALCEEGPVGLLRMAEALGYQRVEYVQKCHLCWEVRRFLRPHYPEVLGPDEIYGTLLSS
jgi:hypothetical protein